MAVSNQDVYNWLINNQEASDADIASAMDQYKVSPAQLAEVTGMNIDDVNTRYALASGAGGLSNVIGGNNTVLEDTSNNITGGLSAVTSGNNAVVEDTSTDTTAGSGALNQFKPVDLGNGTFRTYGGNIIDANGYPVTSNLATAANTATDTSTSV